MKKLMRLFRDLILVWTLSEDERGYFSTRSAQDKPGWFLDPEEVEGL